MGTTTSTLGARRLLLRAAAVGSIWGLACYGVLWEGVPVVVDRPFVESVVGTLVLLPARAVLEAILLYERTSGRAIDLADAYAIIAPVAAATGAMIAAGLVALARGAARAARAVRRS